MPKYKIIHKGFKQIIFPYLCPHCLTTDEVAGHIEFTKRPFIPAGVLSMFIPGGQVISSVMFPGKTLNWPICSTCFVFRHKASKMETFIFFWAILATLAGMWAFMRLPIFREGHAITGFLLFFIAPVSVVVVTAIYVRKRKRELATSMGLPFTHEPIQVISLARGLFGTGNRLKFYCYHADYALAYRQVNWGNGKIKIKPEPK